MCNKNSTRQIRLYLLGACILFAGLLGAVAIYVTASDDNSNAIAYEIVNGEAYAIMAYESKSYRHDLERFGGKAAVMADDFNRWFSGLWMGKRLAYTLAVLATGIALGCFVAARRLSNHRPLGEDRDG
ncbi:hypothetical protein [Propionivibrio sp.]|uniref:hypothetical protein n=1 Tax=Propionivibrio sp. TaxID=2212460 RepID=UPI002603FCD6|nr:hypothetical protein [Propionivibrio sp.]